MRLVKSLISCLFLLCTLTAFSQVFPGDTDNNGVVNNIDVLYVGYAYGETGPSRLEENQEFSLQFLPSLWSPSFPGGLNYAFADADGNGLIDFLDLSTVHSNYGQVQTGIGTTEYFRGIPGAHAPIQFAPGNIPPFLTEGARFEIPLYLGSADLPVEDFNGIAFTIECESELIQEISFEPLQDSWIMENEAAFFFEGPALEDEKQIEVAFSRYGKNPVSGHGAIGTVSFIIQDDLIALLPSGDSANATVRIKYVKMKNGDFWDIPVVDDSLKLMIYHPDILAGKKYPSLSEQVNVFPNPARETMNIRSPIIINRIELFSTTGKKVLDNKIEHKKTFTINKLDGFSRGTYFMRLYGEEAVLTKKILLK